MVGLGQDLGLCLFASGYTDPLTESARARARIQASLAPVREPLEGSALPQVGLPSSSVIPCRTFEEQSMPPPACRPGIGPGRHRGRPAQSVVDRRAGDRRLQPLDAVRAPVSKTGYRQLIRFAERWPQASWALRAPSAWAPRSPPAWPPMASRWSTCQPSSPRRVRLLSSGHGRKTDEADALSVGIAAHTATRLHTATVDEAITALRALIEHREDLVRVRSEKG
jgi:hypothetical protein